MCPIVILIAQILNKGQHVATAALLPIYAVCSYLISSEKLPKPEMQECMSSGGKLRINVSPMLIFAIVQYTAFSASSPRR